MNTTTDHPSKKTGSTQCERVLARLLLTPNVEVPMPELARLGAGKPAGFCMVHSRVADLRRKGWVIEQRNEHVHGDVHSFYKLVIV